MTVRGRQKQASTVGAVFLLVLVIEGCSTFGQTSSSFACLPIAEQAGRDVGCWLIPPEPLGQLSQSEVFWYLDVYPTRAAAEAAKGPRGTVVEALGKVWLFTIQEAGWRPSGGVRAAGVGPLVVTSGQTYTAQYAVGIRAAGDVTPKHRHPGPEAWYVTAGAACAETPDGKTVAGPGESIVIQADRSGWSMMTLVTTGTETRRSFSLVLHQSVHNWAAPAPEWTPKGLCKS